MVSVIAPSHPTFLAKSASLGIVEQALGAEVFSACRPQAEGEAEVDRIFEMNHRPNQGLAAAVPRIERAASDPLDQRGSCGSSR